MKRLRGSRFGNLVTRTLEDGGLFGDVSILHEHLPPRTELPKIHHRRTAEFVYCTAGSMTAYLGRRKYRVTAGSVLLIPRGVRHRFVTGSSSCEAISLFSPALAIGPGADIHIEP
ncbi:MAG: cupin domain-containing protein [Elusimicrobia bacterium]|nr:cupin domain-containing protein [Elusimicrobiota bacterium]